MNQWNEQGVPFKTHLYVPEVHPVTGMHFCEREDEGHVFKVCVCVYKGVEHPTLLTSMLRNYPLWCMCIEIIAHPITADRSKFEARWP